MTWLTPLTGAFLAAAVIPPLILLYFLKLRRRSQAIACTLLWQKSIEDLRANAPFQKLRRSLLLFLQLLALTLLILSVMQPQIQAGRNRGGKTVILVDNSASMTATDTDTERDRTRLDIAKDRVKDRIEELYSGGLLSTSPGETMVIAFSDRAEILCRFSRSKQELLDAVDRIQPTHGGTRFEEALKLARAYTTNVDPESDRPVGAPATLEVWTDGRIADLDDQVLRGETMRYHRLGQPEADNLGLGAIKVDRPYDRPSQVEVFASLINFNTRVVKCDVQLSVDVTARAVRGIDVPAATIDAASGALVPGRQSLVFTPFDQPRGAIIEVAILRDDDLAVDNIVREVVPPPKQLSVALVATKSFLIQTVLEGMALRRLELLTESRYERLAESGGLDAYDVIVFDNYAPPAGMLPAGRYLSFGAAPPVEGLNEFGRADLQIVLDALEQHPVMRFVRIDDLIVVNGRLIQPADDIETIVEGSAGPIIVSVSRGSLRVLHVTFDPSESNWPFHRSWVTFVFNAIDYLGHVGEGLTAQGFTVGEALTTRLPSDAGNVSLETPDERTLAMTPADPTMFSWGPIRYSGLYLLSWTSAVTGDVSQNRAFAVNMLDEFEGRIAPIEQMQLGQDTVTGRAAAASAYTALWPYAIMLCIAVLMLEWWVYHRKTYL